VKRERRRLTCAELERITSTRPVVHRVRQSDRGNQTQATKDAESKHSRRTEGES
jgi:hypothetical protein